MLSVEPYSVRAKRSRVRQRPYLEIKEWPTKPDWYSFQNTNMNIRMVSRGQGKRGWSERAIHQYRPLTYCHREDGNLKNLIMACSRYKDCQVQKTTKLKSNTMPRSTYIIIPCYGVYLDFTNTFCWALSRMAVKTAVIDCCCNCEGKLSQVPLQVCLYIDMLVPADITCGWISLLCCWVIRRKNNIRIWAEAVLFYTKLYIGLFIMKIFIMKNGKNSVCMEDHNTSLITQGNVML